MNLLRTFSVWLALPMLAARALAAGPWPAEAHAAAVRLTDVDSGLDVANWSGAFWNPQTRTLWLACNSGYFWALVEDGAGSFQVATNSVGAKAKWSPGGDLEAICQTEANPSLAYLMDENGWIREYDVSQPGTVIENRNWDIRAQCPEVSNTSGPEGLAFVPDEWLRRQGFRQADGTFYASTNGMDGLMFVGYQADGFVYAFDLNRSNNSHAYVGRYKTGRSETADLEFDRATGKLYVWHNVGDNYLEVTELGAVADGADRRLRPLAEYTGPRTGNLEGFALAPASGAEERGGCILTDDDNLDGEAIAWYRQFQPAADTDADGLSDGWELWNFGTTTQTVGAADSDHDRLSNADEEIAGTDPNDETSALILLAPAVAGPQLALSWQSATGRTYAIHAAEPLKTGFVQIVQTNIAATAPVNVATLAVSGLASQSFFRIAVEKP